MHVPLAEEQTAQTVIRGDEAREVLGRFRDLDPFLTAGGGTSKPDTASGPHDGRVLAGSKRALCWRVVAPSATSTFDTQNIQIVITALTP